MKKSLFIPFILLLLFAVNGGAQNSVPNQLSGKTVSKKKIKFSQVFSNYLNLINSQDTLLKKDKKVADRWMYNEKSRINILEDGTLNFTDYGEAFKLFVENGPFCNDEDISDWENIGPRYVNHANGWVSAVHYNNDPSNEYYLLGGRQCGLFRSTNGGDNWISVTDDLPYPIIGIRQIEANPLNSDRLIAITGDDSSAEALQNNLLFSNDGGENWEIGTNQITMLDGSIQDLDQINEIAFHNQISDLLIGITSNEIILSKDGGYSWRQIDYPFDFNYTNTTLNSIIISGNHVHMVQRIDNELNTNYWSGEFQYNNFSNLWNVNWSLDRSDEFYNPKKLLSDETPYALDGVLYNNMGQSSPNWYRHNLVWGCLPQATSVGRWGAIHTEGWTAQNISGINKATCIQHPSSVNNKEITTERYNNVPIWLWSGTYPGEFEVDFRLPKGAKLKVYLTQKNMYLGTSQYSLCNYPNYDPVIFENLLYESPQGTTDDPNNPANYISFVDDFNPNDFGLNPVETNIGVAVSVYYVLEFDQSEYQGGQFELNTFDLRVKGSTSSYETFFSSTEDNGFFVYAEGIGYRNIYRTLDNGNNYLRLQSPAIPNKIGKNTHMFLASPNDKFTYYIGGVDHQPFRSVGDVNGNQSNQQISGSHWLDSHDDFRSGKIYNLNGDDYIVTGNDGGICEIEAVYSTPIPDIKSINGDVVLNMIYNLDVHEKTKDILIGLQDNGTRHFSEGIDNSFTVHGGDGSVTMYQRELDPTGTSYGCVVGDPQESNFQALKDADYGPFTVPGIVDDNITLEAYLGMRLEEYKTDPTRFITGLAVSNTTSSAHVIMNRAPNQTETVEVPGSWRIESIGICQNQPETAYVADGIPRELGNSKLYKTTDDGYTWNPVNATLNIPGHPLGSPNLTSDIAGTFVNAIGVDHDDPKLVYIGMSGVGEINQVVTNEYFRVLKSTNGGNSFDDWSKGLPALPINYLLPIESESHIIFCATDAGVYYRMDGMERWECYSNNLAKSRITDLSYNYCSRELYASSYGRGVWKTPVNLDTYSSYSEDIVGNVVWNTDRDVRSNIRVKSGSILTIHSNVHIDADRRFIVEPRAKLIIDGGTLTNDCGQYWLGIEVWGDANANQIFANQGHLITRNDAKIEYAKEAVAIWKRGDWSSTGGIVTLQNTTFINNRTSVFFYPYHNYNNTNGNEIINKGSVSNCQFIWDDNYIDHSPEAGVILFNVYGPRISGSDFIDNRAILDPGDSRPTGVFSLDAGYSVVSRATSQNQDIHEVFDVTGGYDVNNFENLEYGIDAMNSETPYTIIMDHCRFSNVKHAAQISAVDNATISRNLVEFTSAHFQDISGSQGFGINESTGYFIEGNTFTSDVPEAFSAGISTWNNGDAENEIRKNYYQDLFLGNYANGINSNASLINAQDENYSGLQWLCNEYKNNKYDEASFAIQGIDGQGVRLEQGTEKYPAGNIFTDPTFPLLNAQLFSSSEYTMKYYYNDNFDPNAQPLILGQNGFYNIIYTNLVNECRSSFTGSTDGISGTIFDDEMKNQAISNINVIEQEIELKQSKLITSSNAKIEKEVITLQKRKAKLANYLITNELSRDEINWLELQEFIRLRNNTVHLAELTDMFTSELQSDNRIENLNTLDKSITDINLPYIQQEMIDFSTFKRYLISITDDNGIVHSLKDKEIEKLSYMADNFTGRSAIQARNILCFHADLCKENDIILPSEKSTALIPEENEKKSLETNDQRLVVSPNPTKGNFILTVQEACEIKSLKIFDPIGNSIPFESEILSKFQLNIKLSQAQNGLLFIHAKCENDDTYTTTIVLEK